MQIPLWICGGWVLEPSSSHVIVIAVFFCDCLLNNLSENARKRLPASVNFQYRPSFVPSAITFLRTDLKTCYFWQTALPTFVAVCKLSDSKPWFQIWALMALYSPPISARPLLFLYSINYRPFSTYATAGLLSLLLISILHNVNIRVLSIEQVISCINMSKLSHKFTKTAKST